MLKIFCLIFWVKAKSRTVLEQSEDLKGKNEGDEVIIPIDGKELAAILLRRSG